jgi:hypothetical protein
MISISIIPVLTEDFETAKEIMNSSVWSPRFPSGPIFKEHTYNQNLGKNLN